MLLRSTLGRFLFVFSGSCFWSCKSCWKTLDVVCTTMSFAEGCENLFPAWSMGDGCVLSLVALAKHKAESWGVGLDDPQRSLPIPTIL